MDRVLARAEDAVGPACVEHLFGRIVQIGEHVGLAAHPPRGVEHCRFGALDDARAAFERATLGPPLAEAAIEDRNRPAPCLGQRKPRPRRGFHGAVVIHDDGRLRCDPQGRKPGCDLLAGRQCGGNRRGGVGQARQVEEARSRYVRSLVFGARVAPGGGQVARGVENGDALIVQPRGQPFGRNEARKIVHRPAGSADARLRQG
ncbi:hypothetical protein EH32_12060 [Erythrobacter litoralis]|uniref:Uncharacterized protein n=1 Tax=Erythrobacter litoralis TaxID=39960 RepID=A0A074N675_9SPHN|nr:hypothetical protein EH32_12060 [Erythrobacter litoralis]